MKKYLLLGLTALALLFSGFEAKAQPYSGLRAYDGEHRNEISGYLIGGSNVITGSFFGEAATYTHHFTDRWSITAGQQVQFLKWQISTDVMGTYRLPVGRRYNLYFDARILNNFYARWHTQEFAINASAYWEGSYFDMRLGLSYVHLYRYWMNEEYLPFSDKGYTEPPMLTFGIGANVHPRSHPWNIGVFFRNYDHYYYDIWNINWGLRFHATLPYAIKLYGELCFRPAGSLSQLATRYEIAPKLGIKYAF